MTKPSINNPSQPANRPQGRPRLDAAFPSIRLMGAAVFLVVLGLVFSGWNIVHLDRQRVQLNRMQEELARERAAFDDRLAEMPDLERRHAELEAATSAQARERKIVAEEVERLERQRQEVQKILEESRSAYHLAQSAREEAQRELTEIMTEINSARPMLIVVEARLAVLKAKEHSLREDLDRSRTEKSQMAADVKGLERERDHARDLLEKMINDRKTLQDFSDTVKAGARDLGQAAKEADAAAKKFAAVTSDLGDSTRSLKAGTTDMTGRVKALETQIAQLTARNQALATAAAADEKTRRDLKSQLDLLTGTAGSLNQAGKDLEGQVRKWTQRSDQTLTEVGRVREALSPLPGNLTAALKSLSAALEQLSAQGKNLEGQATAMRTLATPLQSQARDFANTTKILQEEADKGRKSGEDLRRQLDELQQSVDAARELLKTVSAGLPEAGSLPGGQAQGEQADGGRADEEPAGSEAEPD
jgi:hypothetical protein